MQDFEKLGAFYLGRLFDPESRTTRDDLLLYDAKDLTTHAVCVGMTGSGKTGLCLSLLEEAAIDGIPAIAIDPKGDLGNLFLTFPELRPEDFRPWIDEQEATRKGETPDAYAAKVAALWKKGLGDWGQDGARIARFRSAVDLAIYTPGSSAGRPLRILRSFDAPSEVVRRDPDALRDRVLGTVSGLLALLGIDPDPIRSREHILLSNLLQRAWLEGRGLDLGGLIREIQSPPFDRVGVVDVESFFPTRERTAFSMTLNNLLASPGFAAWMEGEPLDVQRLLWTESGRPRLSIVSIAHLADAERMFLVTSLLNEVVAWMRGQSGTGSLRALLYMDEVFGYLPPTAQPPSKLPMLTLLKQARAFGLGVVLATQNPVDLDYKALSNTGSWFLGRLQTERDKARVLDGLEGAAASAGGGFDRARMEATLAGLQSRVFLLNNVHENEPALFQTRWAMSYLRGPLTRPQIQELGRRGQQSVPAAAPAPIPAPLVAEAPAGAAPAERPVTPSGVEERFLASAASAGPGHRRVYRPVLCGTARLHFVQASRSVDAWRTVHRVAELDDGIGADPWGAAETWRIDPAERFVEPESGTVFAPLPSAALRASSYPAWGKKLAAELYRSETLPVWTSRQLRETSEPGESEGDFRSRLRLKARERRDLELAKIEKKYRPKLERLAERIRQAETRVERERSQYGQQKMQTAISVGATLLGALLGRKAASVGTVGRATTAMRGAGRAARERDDVQRAQTDVEALNRQLEELETEFQGELARIRDEGGVEELELERHEIKPRKTDIEIVRVALLWTPWRVDPAGIAEPLWDRGTD